MQDEMYSIEYTYNTQGLLDVMKYPTSTAGYRLQVKYDYNYGVLSKTRDANGSTVFWQLNSSDAFGNAIDETLGNGVQVISSYDPSTGWIESRQSGAGGSTTNRQNLAYGWDVTGTLRRREDVNGGLTEVFSYDALNRLSGSTLNGATNLSVSIDGAGNTLSKDGVTYGYDTTYKRADLRGRQQLRLRRKRQHDQSCGRHDQLLLV
jgi:hypothetical protein